MLGEKATLRPITCKVSLAKVPQGRATGTARLNFRLSAPSRLQASVANQQIRLRVTGPASRAFTIESSLDLRAWTRLLTTNAPTSVLDWSVPLPPLTPAQFYRVSQGP